MLKEINYSNLNLIFFLCVMLIVLLALRRYLFHKINEKTLEVAQEISIGQEEIQEDYGEVITTSNGTLAVMADGLGNNEAGRISSITSVKTIIKMFEEEGSKDRFPYFFNKAFNKANLEILKRVENDRGGASVMAVAVTNNLLNYALAGDVMLAVFRNKELIKLSNGHTISELAQKEYYKGKLQKKEALYAIKERKLLYYIGQEALGDIELSETPIRLNKNDIIVIMTKGVYEGLRWTDFEKILGDKNCNINEKCEIIMGNVENNNKNNSNGSIILMKCKSNGR